MLQISHGVKLILPKTPRRGFGGKVANGKIVDSLLLIDDSEEQQTEGRQDEHREIGSPESSTINNRQSAIMEITDVRISPCKGTSSEESKAIRNSESTISNQQLTIPPVPQQGELF